MRCKTKRIISLILCLFLVLSNRTLGLAKTNTMYAKKATVIRCKKNKVIVPQYHRVKVKLKKKVTKLVQKKVVDFNDETSSDSPLATIVNNEKQQLSVLIMKKYSIKWLLPKRTSITIDNNKGKIKTKRLTNKKPKGVIKKLPSNSFKSYMSYRAISSTGSPQYKLQAEAYTDSATGVRMVDGRYCIAVGPKIATKIGTKLELIYKSGKRVPAIVADQKAGTIDGYRHPDGSAVEFVIDNSALPRCARLMGDMSALKKFKGRITSIKVFNK